MPVMAPPRRRRRSAEQAIPRKTRRTVPSWVHTVLASKDHELAAVVASKDHELAAVVASKDHELASKDHELAAVVAAKDAMLDAKDKAFKAKCGELKAKRGELKAKCRELSAVEELHRHLVIDVSKLHLVLANRIIIENGLREYDNTCSTTAALNQFRDSVVMQGKTLSTDAKNAACALERTTNLAPTLVKNVVRELDDLYHELSKPLHFHVCSSSNMKGLACGGPHPLGLAVGIVVLLLQKWQCIQESIVYVDGEHKAVMKMVAGKVEAL